MPSDRTDTYRRIYDVVRRIPKGRVATYGQVAKLAGFGEHARLVGYALHALPRGTRVPWFRVINAKGEISVDLGGHGEMIQRHLLEEEGIVFDSAGRILLAQYRWLPRKS